MSLNAQCTAPIRNSSTGAIVSLTTKDSKERPAGEPIALRVEDGKAGSLESTQRLGCPSLRQTSYRDWVSLRRVEIRV
jgi:hypothetical protein